MKELIPELAEAQEECELSEQELQELEELRNQPMSEVPDFDMPSKE